MRRGQVERRGGALVRAGEVERLGAQARVAAAAAEPVGPRGHLPAGELRLVDQVGCRRLGVGLLGRVDEQLGDEGGALVHLFLGVAVGAAAALADAARVRIAAARLLSGVRSRDEGLVVLGWDSESEKEKRIK